MSCKYCGSGLHDSSSGRNYHSPSERKNGGMGARSQREGMMAALAKKKGPHKPGTWGRRGDQGTPVNKSIRRKMERRIERGEGYEN